MGSAVLGVLPVSRYRRPSGGLGGRGVSGGWFGAGWGAPRAPVGRGAERPASQRGPASEARVRIARLHPGGGAALRRVLGDLRAGAGGEGGRVAGAVGAGAARAWQGAGWVHVAKMHYQEARAAHVRANAAKLRGPVERFERLCWLRNSQSDSVMLQGLPRTVPQSNGQEGRQST